MCRFSFLLNLTITVLISSPELPAQNTVHKGRNNPVSVDVMTGLKNQIQMNLSDFADSIRYIPLKGLPEVPITWVLTAEITPEDIFIFASHDTGILRFNHSGKLISRIGTYGKGPGELTRGSTFSLSPEEKRVVVDRNFTHNILLFGYDGKFIKEGFPDKNRLTSQTVVLAPDRILKIGSKWSPPETIPPGLYEAAIFDSKGNCIQQIPSPLKNTRTWKSLPHMLSASSIVGTWSKSWYQNRYLFDADASDTVYEASSEGIEAKYYLDMGKYSLPPELNKCFLPTPLGDPKDFIVNELVFETDDFLLFRARFKGNCYMIRMNKKDQAIGSLKTPGLPDPRMPAFIEAPPAFKIPNDLDGGVPFYPEFTNREGTLWISSISAIDYLEQIKELAAKGKIDLRNRSNKAVSVYHQLKEDDNPVLQMVYLKKNRNR